jgi:hypothetical protein
MARGDVSISACSVQALAAVSLAGTEVLCDIDRAQIHPGKHCAACTFCK